MSEPKYEDLLETVRWISGQTDLFFAECSQAEEIVSRCRQALVGDVAPAKEDELRKQIALDISAQLNKIGVAADFDGNFFVMGWAQLGDCGLLEHEFPDGHPYMSICRQWNARARLGLSGSVYELCALEAEKSGSRKCGEGCDSLGHCYACPYEIARRIRELGISGRAE